jgi:membrane protein DedA with SNARE-associated domain
VASKNVIILILASSCRCLRVDLDLLLILLALVLIGVVIHGTLYIGGRCVRHERPVSRGSSRRTLLENRRASKRVLHELHFGRQYGG